MSLLASDEELAAIATIAQVRAWAGLQDAPWTAVDAVLGNVPSLRVLASLSPDQISNAVNAADIPIADTDPEETRNLTPVEMTQVGLMYRVARQKCQLKDVDPLAASAAPGTPTTSLIPTILSPPPIEKKERKIKMSQVVDQTDDSEIPGLSPQDHQAFWARLKKIKGGEVRPDAEPSDDQIMALKTRIVDLHMSPYADFALFTNFHLRFLKTLKFMNHIPQADGTFKTVEVPGPPDFDAWYASWKVYENTILGLSIEDPKIPGDNKLLPVISQGALDVYRDSFRDLVKSYPECWHLCVIAEDRCRAEHMTRLNRRSKDEYLAGLCPSYNPAAPWEHVFRRAALDRDYWGEFVREPALKFIASGEKRKGAPTGSVTGEIEVASNNGGQRGKKEDEKPRKRTKPSMDTYHSPMAGRKGGGRKGNGKGNGKDTKGGKGKSNKTREGKSICYPWQDGGCSDPCPRGFAHVCQRCLGGHRSRDCKTGN